MTRRYHNRLTATAVRNITEPGKYSDGGGLVLIVNKSGQKRWLFFYTRAGKRWEMGLGRASDISLATARAQANDYRQSLALGMDPKVLKRKSAPVVTFGEFADEYIEAMKGSWRSRKHVDQWVMTVAKYTGRLRTMPINEITTEDIVSVLKPRWSKTPETASRLRGRIENILDSARVLGLREGENPARWRGHLDKILPKPRGLSRGHHAALPFAEIPRFMQNLEAQPGTAALALRFAILTAARTLEVLGAQWEEVDFAGSVWTVPKDRMKSNREHRVPLSALALDLLRSLHAPNASGIIFRRSPRRVELSVMAMPMLLRRLDAAVTVHGFRSTFRDWAAETTNFSNEVCEMALAHVISGKTEAAYRRGDLFLKRQRLMDQWANYCAGNCEETVIKERSVQLPEIALVAGERDSLVEMLGNTRCPVCRSAWGELCQSEAGLALEWRNSHDRRLMRLVEDWGISSDEFLRAEILQADGSGHTPKTAVMKVELARRMLAPPAWLSFAFGQDRD
jgi:integrase